jgi:subtilase family serine protease
MLRFFAVLACSAIIAGCSSGAGGGSISPQPLEQQQSATSAAVNAPFQYSVHPKVRRLGDFIFRNCPGTTVCALTPTTLRTSYSFTYVKGASDGTGQTIVIVDAFGSPNILQDLQKFSSFNSLPAPVTNAGLSCTGNKWNFCVVYPGGKPSVNVSNANQLGWAEETSLDVEWAHASAPGARIALVVGNNDQGSTIQSTIQYATSQFAPAILSLSFGTQELAINGGANNTQLTQSNTIYSNAATMYHDTVIASAGDLGSSAGFASPNPEYPASNPNVVAVGGTNLSILHNGKWNGETVWNDGVGCTQPCGATGGALSGLFPDRGNIPDVAYAANDEAVAIWMSFVPGAPASGAWYAIGGTSVGPPAWAGIAAIANQERAALSPARNPLGENFRSDLLSVSGSFQTSKSPPFHAITSGDNIFYNTNPPLTCCSAAAGSADNPTGLGTPIIDSLINYLVNNVQ